MRVLEITDRLGNDMYGKLECEHCGKVRKFVGYDDANWWDNVLPKRACDACGKDANGDYHGNTLT